MNAHYNLERKLLSNADVHRGLALSFLYLCVCGGGAEDNLRGVTSALLPWGPAGNKLSGLQKVNHFTHWASLKPTNHF